MIAKKGLKVHMKTKKHEKLMEGYVSPVRLCEHDYIQKPAESVEIIKTANKTRIQILPQALQDMIYEFAADRTAKDNFIMALPELFRFKLNLPDETEWDLSYVKTAKLLFFDKYKLDGINHTHQYSKFMIKFKTSDIVTIRKFDSLENLSDHIYYSASRQWAAECIYDETQRYRSMIQVMQRGFRIEGIDVLHIINSKNIQIIKQGEFNETTWDWDQYKVPYYLHYLIGHPDNTPPL
jgi:hypothetical protein